MHPDRARETRAIEQKARREAAERSLNQAMSRGAIRSWDKIPAERGACYRISPQNPVVRMPSALLSLTDVELVLAGIAAGLTARPTGR